ncbi:nitric oxide reductase activation protein NorD [Dissulfuribacter thermophilus]|uniref:nitric oxide reductase activation protein NorD n=1 Tax=Dissulfuribacter thermophilus TaxID=1156395 RepID=UPI000ACC684D|nr:VWA domain-containing protein [Dissulfuribacter thermophilus]
MSTKSYSKNLCGPDNLKTEQALRSALLEIFFSENIGHYHVDQAVESLLKVPKRDIGPVLSLVRLIAYSVSDLLAFSFIENVPRALEFLDTNQLRDWVTGALAVYEEQGLHPAEDYLARPEETSLQFCRANQFVSLDEVASRLTLLVTGITGKIMPIKKGDRLFTDTEKIYLRDHLSLFPSRQDNELLLKIMILHKCAQTRYASFNLPLLPSDTLKTPKSNALTVDHENTGIFVFLKNLHKDIEVASRLYVLVDTVRIEAALKRDFPGIFRDLNRLKQTLILGMQKSFENNSSPVLKLASWILQGYHPIDQLDIPPEMRRMLSELIQPWATASQSAVVAKFLAGSNELETALDEAEKILPYIGTASPTLINKALLKRRKECEKKFLEIMAAIIATGEANRGKKDKNACIAPLGPSLLDKDKATALITGFGTSENERTDINEILECILLSCQDESLAEELRNLISEIKSDLGHVPSSYVSSGFGLSTNAWADVNLDLEEEGEGSHSFFAYDEWDFRRQAYRKRWCTLREIQLTETTGDFVDQTLKRYRGQISILKRQFEMLRPQHCFLKRQSEGEEIDLDAVVEAYSDIHARCSPSEHLFIRQERKERDIAVTFLVDMSASTEGWINRSIKEALILLCESLNVLEDQYAIYGFSGMRRTGCHFFRIKDFDEAYGHSVKAKISGITPRDYTRMGPAIRHVTKLFKEVEARLKILVTLSDGKPEDYDEYKGPYAIEDTRKALLEAREQGIKPFCITIDKEAKQYLPHMYGEVNYVLVKDVSHLHRRIAEIYRLLTT